MYSRNLLRRFKSVTAPGLVRVRAAVLTMLFVLRLAESANAEDYIGQVKITSGEVVIERDGQQIAIKPGSLLYERDVVRTGDKSAIGMTFIDNSRMSLGPNSSLTLEAFEYNKSEGEDSFDARLTSGSLTAAAGQIAKRRPLAMRVLMPTTVLGVKGTEFAVRVKD